MRLGIFVIALAICLVLDSSFLMAFAIGGVHPMATAVLMVFVGLFAPRRTVLWTSLVAGIFLDLATVSIYRIDEPFFLIGPYAMGCVFGANLILPIRTMVFRRNPIAVGLLTIPYLLAVDVAFMAVWTIRGLYAETSTPWGDASAVSELGRRLGEAIYTGGFGSPFAWILLLTWSSWRFEVGSVRR
jgi:hypothetical protein